MTNSQEFRRIQVRVNRHNENAPYTMWVEGEPTEKRITYQEAVKYAYILGWQQWKPLLDPFQYLELLSECEILVDRYYFQKRR